MWREKTVLPIFWGCQSSLIASDVILEQSKGHDCKLTSGISRRSSWNASTMTSCLPKNLWLTLRIQIKCTLQFALSLCRTPSLRSVCFSPLRQTVQNCCRWRIGSLIRCYSESALLQGKVLQMWKSPARYRRTLIVQLGSIALWFFKLSLNSR